MAKSPELKDGDWLEHDAIKQRQGFLRNGLSKRAEIIHISSFGAMLYLEGEPGAHSVTRADLTRWWNYYVPPAEPEDKWPPDYLQEGQEFYSQAEDGKYLATLRTFRLGWVSYIESSPDFKDVFRIMTYSDFTRHWLVSRRVSVWEWLKNPAVG